MLNLRASWVWLLCCSLLAAAEQGGVPVPARAAATAGAPSPELDFRQLEYQQGKVVLRDIVIRQGDMQVQADLAEATGLDFSDSDWNFSGKVTVKLPEGSLQASHAVVHFKGGNITSATATGAPATFAQQPGTTSAGGISGARGRANQIDYEVAEGDVKLTGNAWLSDDSREISSQLIVYNIPTRNLRAESGTAAERVQGTIKPRSDTLKDPASAPANGDGSP